MGKASWSRDELLLTLDFYFQHRENIPGKQSKELIQLSNQLRTLAITLGKAVDDKYRNVNGVYMKLMNFKHHDPDYSGVGLSGGSKADEEIWSEFSTEPERLKKLSNTVREFLSEERTNSADLKSEIEEDNEDIEASEGKLLRRIHYSRERSATLAAKKKVQFKEKHGSLHCEVCGFNFEKSYGDHGTDFIECHHTIPVSQLTPNSKTKLSELALLCSNCHRMIHRSKQMLSIAELKDIIANVRAG